jgi:hypothetical protein
VLYWKLKDGFKHHGLGVQHDAKHGSQLVKVFYVFLHEVSDELAPCSSLSPLNVCFHLSQSWLHAYVLLWNKLNGQKL